MDHRLVLFLALGAVSLSGAESPIKVGARKQLFLDRKFIRSDSGITLRANPPIKMGVAIKGDRPWELGWVTGSGHVAEDGGRFKMWYVVLPPQRPIGAAPGLLCYAESDDGRAWRKPNLGLYEWNGSTANNILMPAVVESNVFVDPAAPAAERYKFIANVSTRQGMQPPQGDGMYVYTSADGLRWRLQPTRVFPFLPDTVNHALYDTRLKKYVVYVRIWDPLRKVGRIEVEDILRPWPYDRSASPPSVLGSTRPHFPGKHVPAAFGYDEGDPQPSDHYNPAAVQYPWAEDVYLMFPSAYRHFPPPPRGKLANEGLLDIQMAVSRDGVTFTRPARWPYVENGLDGSPDSRQMYMLPGMIRVGQEIFQYYSGYPFTHGGYQGLDESWLRGLGSIFRVAQRPDGFVSVEAEMAGGSFTTPVLEFEGRRLALNLNASSMGEVRVQLADGEGKAIPGFEFDQCDPLYGNHLERVVSWQGKSDLDALASRPVRIGFRLSAAKLYAFQFVK
jgi:hypothetical protein